MSQSPTAYKVSTITATGSLNSLIDLEVLYEHLDIVPYEQEDKTGFIFIEFGVRKSETIYRGFNKKLLTVNRKRKAKKRFDNQVTVILRTNAADSLQYVNIKVFKNGNVQMTGLKHIEQGHQVIDKVIDQIMSIQKNGNIVAETIDKIRKTNYKICLINSDFRMGLEIKRDKLNKLMQNEYGVYSSFEPCIYPGVKIQFCWNMEHGEIKNGVCECSCECEGKGTGQGEGQCKKITIAVFQSGCIIITGAQTYEQIDDAYAFICKAVQKHKKHIHKVPIEISMMALKI